jgi:hypothetical protein
MLVLKPPQNRKEGNFKGDRPYGHLVEEGRQLDLEVALRKLEGAFTDAIRVPLNPADAPARRVPNLRQTSA